MGNIIHGQFGRPRKIIQSSLSVNLDQFTLTVDGEDWLVVTLNGDVVQVVPIQPGTAPEPKKLARVLRFVNQRGPESESPLRRLDESGPDGCPGQE